MAFDLLPSLNGSLVVNNGYRMPEKKIGHFGLTTAVSIVVLVRYPKILVLV